MTIIHMVRCGLIATALDYEQCDTIMQDILVGVFPKMGHIRTINRILTTAKNIFEFGLTHVYVLQLIDHLKILCDHSWQEMDTLSSRQAWKVLQFRQEFKNIHLILTREK